MVVLTQPIWLVLLIPVGLAWYFWRLPSRLMWILRGITLAAVVLALCHPAIRLKDRSGTVVVVADRSASMPEGVKARQEEMIGLVQKDMTSRDRLAVVTFGHETVVERAPKHGEFTGFLAEVDPHQSSLSEAIDMGLTLIPSGEPGRILVLSDGKWTGTDPASAGARAAGRGVAVDYRWLSRPQLNEVAIQEFQVPQTALPGQAFMVNSWVYAPTEQEIDYRLTRNGTVISAGKRKVTAGLSRLLFRDRAGSAGTIEYRLTVQGQGEDPVPENNSARSLMGIDGPKPILLVSGSGSDSGLAKLLAASDVPAVVKVPEACRWSLEELSRYSAVILENVMANDIGSTGMKTLLPWIEEAGNGLMLTGGQRSYAPGGYYGSPLERVLPVSMEMRNEHRKLSLAIVVALDRSGSMAAPAGGGQTKMDLANIGTVEVLDLLSPIDEIGVIAVDSTPHVIVELDTVANNRNERSTILSIDSMGGGIFVFEALTAASQMLLEAKAETRHIILFSDAADSEEPGQYEELLAHCREANISVSVVGLGTAADVDAPLLEDIARLGDGNIYFTDSPQEIPRLFAQDTFSVARSTFIQEPTPIQITGGMTMIGGEAGWSPPLIGGYNLCYLRPEANLAVVSVDEYAAPVVANWQAGAGRVLCYTGEADGAFSGPIAGWDDIGDFLSTLVRWTAGEEAVLPDNMLLTHRVQDGQMIIELHLDPEREAESFANVPVARILHGLPGQPPRSASIPLQWKHADLLEARVPMRGNETVLPAVEIAGREPVGLAPLCLPYSPEFVPDRAGRGRETLADLAQVSGGEERLELGAIWSALPALPQYVGIVPWLIGLATTTFLLEILERRTGLVSWRRKRRQTQGQSRDAEAVPSSVRPVRLWKKAVGKKVGRQASPVPRVTEPQADGKTASPAPEAAPSTLDAMRAARERARKRERK